MTYCIGLRLNKGLVFMSDTRTNAGVDNISTFKKMFTWSIPGERVMTLLTAGNLASTQAVVSLLEERTKVPDDRSPSILDAPTMFQAARLIGETLREVVQSHANTGEQADSTFDATMIFGGQIAGMAPRLFLMYPEGNFIEASDSAPFFQIGETKYGRPILVRAYDADMSLEAAIKLLLVSFDSTIAANLSVSLPLDVHAYECDSLQPGHQFRIETNNPYYDKVSKDWGKALKLAFNSLPDFKFGN